MSTEICRKTNCPHYATKGQGLGGNDLHPTRGRCLITGRMVSRMKSCPIKR